MKWLSRDLAIVLFLVFAATASAATAPVGRLVVLGFDGVDAEVTERMIAAGKLPHLAELAARGGYARLAPTTPAQTPAS